MNAFTKNIARLTTAVLLNPSDKKKTRIFSKSLEWNEPTLDCIHDSLPAPDSWENKEFTDKTPEGEEVKYTVATPVYSNVVYAFVQTAVSRLALQVAKTRDSAEPAQDVPTDWDSLLEGAGGSPFTAQTKLFREMYTSWMVEQGLTAGQQRTYLKYTDVKSILALASTQQAGVVTKINEFQASLSEEDASSVAAVFRSLERGLDPEAIQENEW